MEPGTIQLMIKVYYLSMWFQLLEKKRNYCRPHGFCVGAEIIPAINQDMCAPFLAPLICPSSAQVVPQVIAR